MEGYVFVDPAGTKTARDLNEWLKRARAFVEALPPKVDKRAKAPAKKATAKRKMPAREA